VGVRDRLRGEEVGAEPNRTPGVEVAVSRVTSILLAKGITKSVYAVDVVSVGVTRDLLQ